MRTIELLSPARDLECGLVAIDHGADAVYIGGPSFGARAAAGNSLADIERLCEYAHLFDARVYVTLNTILYDDELEEAERLVHELYAIGVDALIVQDTALLEMDLPPIALHASTQMDNRTAEKAIALEKAGYSQIVLARELNLQQIREISSSINIPIEAFVHGALCVSYSGRCYASQHCFKRSANRGECAQFCRLKFDLEDEKGNKIIHNRHLLSLRDMNRSKHLEEMMDAGVSSFKIEGRLKDANYVKNVTAYYRQHIDKILSSRNKDYRRASSGHHRFMFFPDLHKAFNRGFTDYFLKGDGSEIQNFFTPKMVGKEIGSVKDVMRNGFQVTLGKDVVLHAGDGLCFYNEKNELQGFRVNRVSGYIVYPFGNVNIPAGTILFRNNDADFEKQMEGKTGYRELDLKMTLREVADGFVLDVSDESGRHVSVRFEADHQSAKKAQHEQIRQQLSRLGGTIFKATEIDIRTDCFIPASLLGKWRRIVIEKLLRAHRITRKIDYRHATSDSKMLSSTMPDTYEANISNRLAAERYNIDTGMTATPAFELAPEKGCEIMTCKYCIRRAMKSCLKDGGGTLGKKPLYLRLKDGRRFSLNFDCTKCEMRITT